MIVISNFDIPLHTIPARMRLPPGVPCLLDVLGCTDNSLAHVVMNQVIDGVGCLTAGLCVMSNKCYTTVCLLVSTVHCQYTLVSAVRFAACAQQREFPLPQTYYRLL